jgi:hypothetical protein
MLKLTTALGVKGLLVIDDELVRRMRGRWETRDAGKVHSRRLPSLGPTTMRRVFKAVASEMGRRGGKARMGALTLEQRREIGRRGAAIRWGHRTLERAGDIWVDADPATRPCR